MSNRECSYEVPNGGTSQSPPAPTSSEPQNREQPTASIENRLRGQRHVTENHTSNGVLLESQQYLGSHQQQSQPTQDRQDHPSSEQGLPTDLNINHMELLIHLTVDNDIFCLSLGDEAFTNPAFLSLALKTGLKSLYLLHALLAISGLHLASLNPTRSDFYLRQAITLQSQSVSLFNSECQGISESNCVAILLFSSILGHHLLAETLAKRDPGGLQAFMANYIHCIEIHRGIHTIAMSAWPQLMESELEPILSSSSRFTSRSPRGNDCRDISELVNATEAFNEEDKEACQLMIRHLQVGFDAAATEQQRGYRHYMIYTWLMLAPPKFIDLLLKRRPEALILLAYYAVLLHYGKDLWQVGDSGVYVFCIIRDYVDPQWHTWLQYPQELILRENQGTMG